MLSQLRRGVLASGLVLATSVVPGQASEVFFSHEAIARALYDAAMTSGGRWYLQGRSAEDCSHAFLQDPRVSAAGERLSITLLFSGRGAVKVGAQCVGPGDTFNVVLTGVPGFVDGELVLQEPRLTAPERPYFLVVRPMLETALREKLRYPVRNAVEWRVHELREQSGRPVLLAGFEVEHIAVEETGVRVNLSFAVDIR